MSTPVTSIPKSVLEPYQELKKTLGEAKWKTPTQGEKTVKILNEKECNALIDQAVSLQKAILGISKETRFQSPQDQKTLQDILKTLQEVRQISQTYRFEKKSSGISRLFLVPYRFFRDLITGPRVYVNQQLDTKVFETLFLKIRPGDWAEKKPTSLTDKLTGVKVLQHTRNPAYVVKIHNGALELVENAKTSHKREQIFSSWSALETRLTKTKNMIQECAYPISETKAKEWITSFGIEMKGILLQQPDSSLVLVGKNSTQPVFISSDNGELVDAENKKIPASTICSHKEISDAFLTKNQQQLTTKIEDSRYSGPYDEEKPEYEVIQQQSYHFVCKSDNHQGLAIVEHSPDEGDIYYSLSYDPITHKVTGKREDILHVGQPSQGKIFYIYNTQRQSFVKGPDAPSSATLADLKKNIDDSSDALTKVRERKYFESKRSPKEIEQTLLSAARNQTVLPPNQMLQAAYIENGAVVIASITGGAKKIEYTSHSYVEKPLSQVPSTLNPENNTRLTIEEFQENNQATIQEAIRKNEEALSKSPHLSTGKTVEDIERLSKSLGKEAKGAMIIESLSWKQKVLEGAISAVKGAARYLWNLAWGSSSNQNASSSQEQQTGYRIIYIDEQGVVQKARLIATFSGIRLSPLTQGASDKEFTSLRELEESLRGKNTDDLSSLLEKSQKKEEEITTCRKKIEENLHDKSVQKTEICAHLQEALMKGGNSSEKIAVFTFHDKNDVDKNFHEYTCTYIVNQKVHQCTLDFRSEPGKVTIDVGEQGKKIISNSDFQSICAALGIDGAPQTLDKVNSIIDGYNSKAEEMQNVIAESGSNPKKTLEEAVKIFGNNIDGAYAIGSKKQENTPLSSYILYYYKDGSIQETELNLTQEPGKIVIHGRKYDNIIDACRELNLTKAPQGIISSLTRYSEEVSKLRQEPFFEADVHEKPKRKFFEAEFSGPNNQDTAWFLFSPEKPVQEGFLSRILGRTNTPSTPTTYRLAVAENISTGSNINKNLRTETKYSTYTIEIVPTYNDQGLSVCKFRVKENPEITKDSIEDIVSELHSKAIPLKEWQLNQKTFTQIEKAPSDIIVKTEVVSSPIIHSRVNASLGMKPPSAPVIEKDENVETGEVVQYPQFDEAPFRYEEDTHSGIPLREKIIVQVAPSSIVVEPHEGEILSISSAFGTSPEIPSQASSVDRVDFNNLLESLKNLNSTKVITNTKTKITPQLEKKLSQNPLDHETISQLVCTLYRPLKDTLPSFKNADPIVQATIALSCLVPSSSNGREYQPLLESSEELVRGFSNDDKNAIKQFLKTNGDFAHFYHSCFRDYDEESDIYLLFNDIFPIEEMTLIEESK